MSSTPPHLSRLVGAEAAYTNGEPWLEEALEYIEGNIAAMREYIADNLPGVDMITPRSFVPCVDGFPRAWP